MTLGGGYMVTRDNWCPLGTDWKIPHLNSRQLEPCPPYSASAGDDGENEECIHLNIRQQQERANQPDS